MRKAVLTFVVALATLAASANSIERTSVISSDNSVETLFKSPVNSFCQAIIQGKTDLVKQMIALGEDVNKKCLGKTPAMFAARYNKPEILQLLIENGANLKVKSDDEKYTAKKFAELSNATDALEVIEESVK